MQDTEKNKQQSGASNLIKEINELAQVFADDLRLIREGIPGDTKYIGKTEGKKFEHAIKLFETIDKFNTLEKMSSGDAEVKKEAKLRNIQDLNKA